MSPKRPATSDERDVLVRKHPTPSPGVPFEIPDEVTGQYEGDELARIRSKRPTHERLSILERKSDEDRRDQATTREAVARMEGKLDTALTFITNASNQHHQTSRVAISTRGKVIIGIVTAAIGASATVLVAALGGCS